MKNLFFTLCCLMLLEEAKAAGKNQRCKNNGSDTMCSAQEDNNDIAWCAESDADCGVN